MAFPTTVAAAIPKDMVGIASVDWQLKTQNRRAF